VVFRGCFSSPVFKKSSGVDVNQELLKWIRPEIRALKAYHVADAGGMVKLDAMENPYTLPPELLEQAQAGLSRAAINRYPDPAARVLRERIAEVMRVPSCAETVLGNGSDELIQMLVMAVAGEGRSIMSFEPGFVMYSMISRFVGVDYVGVPLTADFSIDMKATEAAIAKHKPAIIFIAYPNNPTGNLFAVKDIERIIELAPGLVVVDEAYQPFAQHSFMPQLENYEQLLVMRTVSKMGLAGLRLGVLCGRPELITEIDKIRLPYNINVLTQHTAAFALEHIEVLDQQAADIREQREAMLRQLASMKMIEVFPSQANFILFRILQGSADEIFNSLCADGVLIKNMRASEGALKNCLRVTVGTKTENDRFLVALERALKKS
jgi:histidinol-phosphate aminotransferase